MCINKLILRYLIFYMFYSKLFRVVLLQHYPTNRILHRRMLMLQNILTMAIFKSCHSKSLNVSNDPSWLAVSWSASTCLAVLHYPVPCRRFIPCGRIPHRWRMRPPNLTIPSAHRSQLDPRVTADIIASTV